MAEVSLYQVGKVLGVNQVSKMAPQVGLTWPPPPPISVKNIIRSPRALQTKTFSQEWTTPSGTALGGNITLVINSDGTYTIDFRTFSSSVLEPFDFWLRAYLQAPGIGTLFFYHAGHVSGDGTDDTHPEAGSNPLIATYWNEIAASAQFSVAHDYKGAGVFGTLEDLVDDLLDIVAGAVGAVVGAVIAVTREALGWLGVTLGPGATIGVIAGVVVFAIGAIAGFGVGAALILGTVAGIVAGAVSNALISYRPMNAAEIQLAQQVFSSELPYNNVMLTNLSGLGGRSFTAPGVDGKTYCNLGAHYDNTLSTGSGDYTAKGELLIHELTHAWQIAHNSFVPGFVCSGVVNQANYVMGDDIYAYGAAGPPWASFNLEQQATIVNEWFGGNGNSEGQGPMNKSNPYYRYISGNILTGSAGYSTSWLASS